MKEKIFIIQKHDAKAVHFDFRLEINGILKSWTIPKGPTDNHTQKRLAIETEDHPMSYADSEGIIPEGNYGAGTVMIWDYGTYENRSEEKGNSLNIEDAFLKGYIKITIYGKRMKGYWTILKTKYQGKDNQWLFTKEKDEFSDTGENMISKYLVSAKTGRTMEKITKNKDY